MNAADRADYIRRIVDQAPPPSPERIAQLRELFRDAVEAAPLRRLAAEAEQAAA